MGGAMKPTSVREVNESPHRAVAPADRVGWTSARAVLILFACATCASCAELDAPSDDVAFEREHASRGSLEPGPADVLPMTRAGAVVRRPFAIESGVLYRIDGDALVVGQLEDPSSDRILASIDEDATRATRMLVTKRHVVLHRDRDALGTIHRIALAGGLVESLFFEPPVERRLTVDATGQLLGVQRQARGAVIERLGPDETSWAPYVAESNGDTRADESSASARVR